MPKILGNTTATTTMAEQTYNPESNKPQSGKAVAEAIANLLGSAPENLDTLEELAKALNEDENFAAKVVAELTKKVDKVDGKGLSTNDFTDADKEKLDGIEERANKTTVDSELSETSTNPVQNKVVLEALNEKAGSIINSVSGEAIQLTDSAKAKLKGFKVFGKTNQMKTTGKNWLDLTSIIGKTISANGGTLTCGDDGGVTGSGTPTDYVSFGTFRLYLSPTNSITLSAQGTFTNIACTYTLVNKDGSRTSDGINDLRRNTTINLSDYPDLEYVAIEIKRNNNNIEMSGTAYFQVEMGTNATEYEPYSGGVASPSPGWEQPLDNVNAEISITDGCEQSSNFIVSNELAGIKVGSNGNYTDSNGQQWVCDEVDFDKSVYIQRIDKLQSYNGEIITTPYMSTTGELSNGATVVYVLDNPIEIPLTEEQISAYKSLQTYKPITNITNNENAYMEVEYAADTKTYIDNKIEDKFTALQNAIVSLGGNV